jgi:hypothetical protein
MQDLGLARAQAEASERMIHEAICWWAKGKLSEKRRRSG